MKKIVFLFLCLVVSSQTIKAHNPLSAMYYLEVKEDINILNISLSQTGLNEALKKHYKNVDFNKLLGIEYKKLAVKYIKDNFYLKINNNEVTLQDGGIKLGNHQTDLKFVLKELPETFKILTVKINAFIENKNHQSVFSLRLNGKTSKIILSQNNNYSASVTFKNNLMINNSNPFNKKYLWFIVIIPIIFLGKKYLL